MDRINALGQRRNKPQGRLLGGDIQEVEPLPGAELMQLDFLDDGADAAVQAALGGPAAAVLHSREVDPGPIARLSRGRLVEGAGTPDSKPAVPAVVVEPARTRVSRLPFPGERQIDLARTPGEIRALLDEGIIGPSR